MRGEEAREGAAEYASEDASPESGQAYYLFADPSGMHVRVEDAMGTVVWQASKIDPYGHLEGAHGAEGRVTPPRTQAEFYLTQCKDLVPDTEDFAGGGVSAALDASCSVLAVLDCIAALEPGQVGERAASYAMEAALAATETAEMIDEHRTSQDGLSATVSENAPQATLLALIDERSDAAIVLARARELGASRDLVQLSYPLHR